MSMNLLALAKSYLNDEVVSQVSVMLGENQKNTHTAINGALPAVLNGLIHKVSEPGGPGIIMDMVAQVMTPNRAVGEVIMPSGGVFSQLGSMFDGSNTQMSSFLAMGSALTTRLFGNKADAVADALSTYSGIRKESSSSLINLAGPVLLGVLGKRMAVDGDGPDGMTSLLNSQVATVQAAMPVGLASLLSTVPGMAVPVADSRPDPVELGSGTASSPPVSPPLTGTPAYTASRESDSGRHWLPWLLLALGAITLFFFMRENSNNQMVGGSAMATSITDTTSAASDASTETSLKSIADSAGSAAGAAVDSVGSALEEGTAALGAFFKRKLPSGYELNIPKNGIENNLVEFIEDKNKAVDKTTWFNFDRLLFDTGKATLKLASQEQVTNIAEVLKAYPAVAIKIGGYTDNTGNPQANVKLSDDRAKTVMNALAALGIDRSRLEAEGYGAEHPVATNDTEAGRAQNRRIAVRVTKK